VRKLVAVGAAVLLGVVLAGCTGRDAPPAAGGTRSPSPGRVTSAATPDPVTLRFAVYGARPVVAAYRELARAFTQHHPRVSVDVEVAHDPHSAMDTLREELSDGDAPDVFLVEHEALPAMVRAGQVHPVDQLLERRGVSFGDNYQRVGLEAFSADSALQCMPHDVSPFVVYYNEDLVKPGRASPRDLQPSARAGWTWPSFVATARAASHDGVNGVYLPPTLPALAALVRSAGGEVMNDPRRPTTLTLSEENTRQPLEQVLALARDDDLTPTRGQLRRHGAVGLFERGRLAMMLGGRALLPELREVKGLRFDVMPLPGPGRVGTLSSTTGYCIAAGTPHLRAAADFLAFAISREGAAITTRTGYVVPANLAVLHSPAFTQPGQEPEHAFVYIESLRQSASPPFVPGWTDLQEQVRPLLDRLFHTEAANVQPLLSRIDQRSRAVLRSRGTQPAA
jgi:multiple sugar transport system substrate-binding protein